MPGSKSQDRNRAQSGRFATTRWTMVRAAGRNSTAESREALAALCSAYWYPLYAFVRRSGHSPAEAEDLTQAFFAQLLEKNYVAVADQARGKFRWFLLAAVKHFLSDRRDHAAALKRGGGRAILSLDAAQGEARYRIEPTHDLTAEKLYQQAWALALLDRVLAEVRAQYMAAGNAVVFDQLKPCLAGSRERLDYQHLADECGMTEGAVKVAVHRLRRRYRDRLRREIAATVSSPQDVEDEIRELFGLFSQ